MEIVRIRLFSTELCDIDTEIFQQCVQFLLCSCMHLARRFASQASMLMHSALTEYLETSEKSQVDQENILKIIGFIENNTENKENDQDLKGFSSILIERVHKQLSEKTEYFYDCMHAALNIFKRARNESFSSERPMELLKLAQPPKELN